jgi:putative flavoprotein involved in K+ transport
MGSRHRWSDRPSFLAFLAVDQEDATMTAHTREHVSPQHVPAQHVPAQHIATVIIGAGQAGLSLSRCLAARGLEHVVLDRGGVAHSWRTQRWDSFTLLSPNWQTRLPGHRYRGPDPEGFMTGAQVVAFFEEYARSFAAPVRTGVTVRRVRPTADGWLLDTTSGTLTATNVVVATGDLGHPRIPAVGADLPADLVALHTSAYRNPAQLPAGTVLVVGAGPSGQQIAAELAAAGRRVHLAVGRHRCLPRRYRGRDTYWWMDRLGMLDRTVDSLPGGRGRSPNAVLAGGVRDLDVRRLVAEGVTAHGRLTGLDGRTLTFADDLPATLADAEGNARRFRATVDAHVAASGLDVPVEQVPEPGDAPWLTDAPRTLDLDDVAAVVWATGFGRDHRYVEAPVLDGDGEPAHRRGVTAAPGLYFLGLRWQYRRNSSFIDGVGADAEFLADQIERRRIERRATDRREAERREVEGAPDARELTAA